jgi:large subunit ribosomal protein L19
MTMDWLKLVHGTPKASTTSVGPGDEVRIWYRILEQGKERLGQFEGIVIRSRGSGPSKTFTVRRVTHGEGVERCFPMDAKVISRIELLRQGKVRRSRLYFLRTAVGKTRIALAEATGGKTIDDVPVVNKTGDAESIPPPSEPFPAGRGR